MRVIICGAGQVGHGIAERLAAEKNDVSVIDTQPELIHKICDTLDVRGIVGHGSHPDVLEAAGAKEADMIIAVTLFDEVNIVACEVAHALFDVPTKIARIRSQAYLHSHHQDLFARDRVPIDVIISPEIEAGEMVLRRIALPGADDVVRFSDGKVYMVTIVCQDDCPVINTPLSQLSQLFPDLPATVVGVNRGGSLFIPRSADQLYAGDKAYVVTTKEQVHRTLSLFGHEELEATRIVIAGGGNIGLYVARAIEQRRSRARVKIIESNEQRATAVADQLRGTVVLAGSALDQRILLEADIQSADLMVSLTNSDQVNLLSCVLAKQLGCKTNLALINNPSFIDLTRQVGIDAHVNPGSVTISRVLEHVRRGRIRAVYSVDKGAGEIIEAEALETSPLVGAPLSGLELPDGMRIGAVYRDGAILKPDGGTRIQPRDRIVIFCLARAVKEVEQLFRVSLEFF